jgi:hypothetical protein
MQLSARLVESARLGQVIGFSAEIAEDRALAGFDDGQQRYGVRRSI